MVRAWWFAGIVAAMILSVSLFSGCGESKLARARRLASVGTKDDPEPAVAPAPAPPPPAVAPKEPAPPTPAPATAVTPPPVVPMPVAPMPAPVVPAVATPATTNAPTPPAPATTVANSAPPPLPMIQVKRPATPLNDRERLERTQKNMQAIAGALEQYMQLSSSVPSLFLDEETQAPLLSWRVAILPQLGHGDLYRKFKLNERWDSPHNVQLLGEIPPEFQSPERFNEKTNYLGAVGRDAAMSPTNNRPFAHFRDGLPNTLLIVEVDDAHAVPWTRPADLQVNLESPKTGIGGLREAGFFAIMANASCGLVPKETPAEQVRALFTIAGGDGPKASEILKSPTGEAVAVAANVAPSVQPMPESGIPQAKPMGIAPAGPTTTSAANGGPAAVDMAAITALFTPNRGDRPGLVAIPADPELKIARDLLREVYAQDYAAAKRPEDRQKLARQLLKDAAGVEGNAAQQHEMLRIARDLAVQVGDLGLAKQSILEFEKIFVVDNLAIRANTIADLQPVAAKTGNLSLLENDSQQLFAEAIRVGNYDAADSVREVLLACARGRGDKQGIAFIEFLKQLVEAGRAEQDSVQSAFTTLSQNPNDPAACQVVGKHLCLLRQKWDLGLPLLARSEDIRFKFVATIDLDPNKTPKSLVQLGDQYWLLADEYRGIHKLALQARTLKCYAEAIPQLPGGLEKIKIQKRATELTAAIGSESLERLAPGALDAINAAAANRPVNAATME